MLVYILISGLLLELSFILIHSRYHFSRNKKIDAVINELRAQHDKNALVMTNTWKKDKLLLIIQKVINEIVNKTAVIDIKLIALIDIYKNFPATPLYRYLLGFMVFLVFVLTPFILGLYQMDSALFHLISISQFNPNIKSILFHQINSVASDFHFGFIVASVMVIPSLIFIKIILLNHTSHAMRKRAIAAVEKILDSTKIIKESE